MPHASLKLIGGVIEVESPALNEAAISSCNMIRFKPDPRGLSLPEKLGGWQKFWNSQIADPVRALHTYQDTNSQKWMVYGTENTTAANLVAVECFTDPITGLTTGSTDGNYIHDITPQFQSDSVIAKITTTAGSATVTITDNTILGLTQYDTVYITTPVSVGGIVLQGMFQIVSKTGTDYQIVSTNILGALNPAVYATVTNPLTVSSAAYSAGPPATIIFHWASPTYTFRAGQSLVVNSVNPVGYNGTFIVSSATTTSVTVLAGSDPGAWVSGGTISNYGTVPWFQTTSGSNTVTCFYPNHGLAVGDTFNVLNETAVNGLTLFGEYRVVSVPNAYSFTFFAPQGASADGTQFYNAITVTGGTGTGSAVTLTFGESTYASTVITPTGGSGDGSHVTLTWSSPNYQFTTGQTIIVDNMDPPAWNGSYAVTSSGINSVSYSNSDTSAFVSAGTVTNAQFDIGAFIWVSGVNPSAWNGWFVVTGVSDSTVTYANTTAGTWVTDGSISDNGGDVDFVYSIAKSIGQVGYGYGVGGYGVGGYGSGISIFPASGVNIPAVTWNITNYGDLTVACPDGSFVLPYQFNSLPYQPIYAWDPINPQQIAQPITNGPAASTGVIVAMPQRQLIAWGTTFSGIIDPLLIRWSDVNNVNTWVGQITNQAGSFRLSSGSEIRNMMQTPHQCLIWTDIELWSMQYIAPPYVYGFNKIGEGCGLIAKNAKAMTAINGNIYWMGPTQFFMLTGEGVSPIPCPVWDIIFQDLDQANLWKITAAGNSMFQEVAWYYPSVSEGSGEVTKYVKFNAQLGMWDYGTLGRSAWNNVSVVGQPIGADQASGFIMQHEVSADADGEAMISSFTTGWFALSDGNEKAYVDQIWPDALWGYYGQAQTATLNVTLTAADYPGSTTYTYGPYALTQATTYISPRVRGRLMSIKVESEDLGSFWRLGNIRYRLQPDGRF